jgi:hypothetical protein
VAYSLQFHFTLNAECTGLARLLAKNLTQFVYDFSKEA